MIDAAGVRERRGGGTCGVRERTVNRIGGQKQEGKLKGIVN
jgi:hypothetical protein